MVQVKVSIVVCFYKTNQKFDVYSMLTSLKSNRMTRQLFDLAKDYCPKLTEPCPLIGRINIYSQSNGQKNFYNLLPKGFFRNTVQVVHERTNTTLTIPSNFEID
jgi:hypothetical protein